MSKRIDTARSSGTYQGDAGDGSGHFQDTDPTGATQLDAQWYEGMQGDVLGLIEGLGGTLTGDETAQLPGLLLPRLTTAGQWSDKIEVSEGAGLYGTTIDAEGDGILLPLVGWVQTGKIYLSQPGIYTGTHASPGTTVLDENLDLDVRDVDCRDVDCEDITSDSVVSGNVQSLGGVQAVGDISTTALLVGAGLFVTTTGDAPTAGTNLQSVAQAAGDEYVILVYTEAATAGCIPMANVMGYTGGDPRIIATVVDPGVSVSFTVKNKHATDPSDEIRVNWWILNPNV